MDDFEALRMLGISISTSDLIVTAIAPNSAAEKHQTIQKGMVYKERIRGWSQETFVFYRRAPPMP